MALTKLIKHKAFQNLRDWFKYHFPNPGFKPVGLDVVDTSDRSSSHAGDVGTAFDYLFRFKIEQMNDIKADCSPETWIAYKALLKLPEDLLEEATEKFLKASFHYLEFIKEGIINDELFEACIFLKDLDIFYRTGKVSSIFGKKQPDKLKELKEIHNHVTWSKFQSESSCFLNPELGKSELNIMADADLIYEKTLIEIKCTNTIKLQRFYINQLIGYCLLNLLKPEEDQFDIDNIGIYFARADYLWMMKLEDFYPKKELMKRAEEFAFLTTNPNEILVPKNIEKRQVKNSLDPFAEPDYYRIEEFKMVEKKLKEFYNNKNS